MSAGHEHPGGGKTHAGDHSVGPNVDRWRLALGLALLVAFMAGEVVAGIVAQSLALLSDAGHMLTDAGALALSLVVIRLAARPPQGGLTYGLKRAEILSGLANGVTLVVIAALIVTEAIRRLVSPLEVDARFMLGVALAGVMVNLVVTWQLARANRRSLNVRGSYQHILTDLYAFIGTAVAAVIILLTGFLRADAIVSIAVAALMVRAAYGLLRDAGRVLLEAAPSGMRPAEIAKALAGHPSVSNVHDLHVWEITSGFPALSAHVLVRPGDDCHAVRRDLEQLLDERFEIAHTTLQVDHFNRQGPISIGSQTDREERDGIRMRAEGSFSRR
jgi:cobalt-zinc-cadmium efflux system protein